QINGPTEVPTNGQASKTDNTTLRVADGANLIIKAGSRLTCTGQMSIVADKHSTILIEDTAQLIFGTVTTKTIDKLALVTFGGEIKFGGPNALLVFSYGQNKFIGNPRSSIDVVDGGQILFNQTAQGVATRSTDGTIGSNLIECTLNKTKIVGSSESNDPVFIVAPNDQVAGLENSTLLNVKNIQCTGNTNMQFMATDGQYGVKAVLNALDQKRSVDAAQLVERLTLAELPKNSQPLNPVRTDAADIPQVTSIIDPLFKYDVRATDKLDTIKRYTTAAGQEVVTGTDQFNHAFSQIKDGPRVG
ncbi:MAG: hypothetical protein EBY16_09665, partial [Gammaproteobacteria bacterium]|nr:hypothetical protein [Gammaproteobacteria bacterium]